MNEREEEREIETRLWYGGVIKTARDRKRQEVNWWILSYFPLHQESLKNPYRIPIPVLEWLAATPTRQGSTSQNPATIDNNKQNKYYRKIVMLKNP